MLKKFLSSFFVKGLGALSGFVLFVALGREFGAATTGVFSIALAIVYVGSAFSRFGIDLVILREASPIFAGTCTGPSGKSTLFDLISNVMAYVVMGSTIFSLLALFVINFYLNLSEEEGMYYSIACLSIVFVSIFNVSFQLLQAQKKVAEAMFVLTLSPQVFLLVLLFILPGEYLYFSVLFAMFTTCCLSLWLIKGQIQRLCVPSLAEQRALLAMAAPLLIGVLAQVMLNWSPALLTSFYLETTEVGVLSVCVRIAALLGFVFIAINGYASSSYSAYFRSNNLNGLKSIFRKSILLMWGFGLPLFLALTIFAQEILLVFGEEFADGTWVLRAVLGGQLIAVVTGPATSLLVMVGETKKYRTVMLVSLVAQLTFIPLGAYLGGLFYAAVAVAICYVLQNVVAYRFAVRCLGNMKC